MCNFSFYEVDEEHGLIQTLDEEHKNFINEEDLYSTASVENKEESIMNNLEPHPGQNQEPSVYDDYAREIYVYEYYSDEKKFKHNLSSHNQLLLYRPLYMLDDYKMEINAARIIKYLEQFHQIYQWLNPAVNYFLYKLYGTHFKLYQNSIDQEFSISLLLFVKIVQKQYKFSILQQDLEKIVMKNNFIDDKEMLGLINHSILPLFYQVNCLNTQEEKAKKFNITRLEKMCKQQVKDKKVKIMNQKIKLNLKKLINAQKGKAQI